MIKIETTVFPEPGATLTYTTDVDHDYEHEELLRHAKWVEETLGITNVGVELALIPMADDFVFVEVLGGHAGSIAGVVKTYWIDYSDVCPGGDGYGN